jgi:hypothetical protein
MPEPVRRYFFAPGGGWDGGLRFDPATALTSFVRIWDVTGKILHEAPLKFSPARCGVAASDSQVLWTADRTTTIGRCEVVVPGIGSSDADLRWSTRSIVSGAEVKMSGFELKMLS